MIVVDASLAAKWFLREADSVMAAAFLDANRDHLAGPDLLLIEVTSSLVREKNMGRLDPREADAMINVWFSAWDSGYLATHPLTTLRLRSAAQIAERLRHPLPDCIYLALAIELDSELATCDAKFFVKAVRLYPAVRMLGDYHS